MTDELYLICHKVRGQPAFDVAIILDTLDEDGEVVWLIPTSGHRAYPYWQTPLDGIEFEGNGNYCLSEELANMPPGHPDHYACNDRSTTTKQPTLLSRLNLHRTQPPIIRRI